jgi:hypothetical protein
MACKCAMTKQPAECSLGCPMGNDWACCEECEINEQREEEDEQGD